MPSIYGSTHGAIVT